MAVAMLAQRRGHLPTVGPGPSDPGWGQSQRWQMEGASPSISTYDLPWPASETDFHSQVWAGVKRLWDRIAVSEPTMTRHARVAAQRSSLPAARFFQSYAHAGTGRATSPASAGGVAQVPHQLTGASRATSAWGAAELHPATTYDPFPSPGSLYPKVV
jgi:hypothetical protein